MTKKPAISPDPLTLDTTLAAAKIASDALAATLAGGLGLVSVRDLLRHFPRRYEDRTNFVEIAGVRHGEWVTVCGVVGNVETNRIRANMTIVRVTVTDSSGAASLVFFNQWFIKAQFEKLRGSKIVVYGKGSRRAGVRGLELTDIEWEKLDPDKDSLSVNRIVPVYALTEGVSQNRMRKLVWNAVEKVSNLESDILAANVRTSRQLPSATAATRDIHYPETTFELANAQRSIIFTEFYAQQVALIGRKRRAQSQAGVSFADIDEPISALRAALPYELTGAQVRVIGEIAGDLALSAPMNRLLQGDVGSGKTAVAMAAIAIAARSGYQAAMMAPTEILAEQHYIGLHRVLENFGVTVAMLTGSMSASAKSDVYARAASGDVQVVVGTHALLQEGVTFAKLGLAIVDEQHRFGVVQRATLKNKGAYPNLLVMTATPIPRTLTLTVYGDLDVSVIDELPPGRKPIRTHWKRADERAGVYESLRTMMSQGRQAYVVCPLIAESEKLQVRAASELAAHLAAHIYPEFRIGLLHGQMKAAEKESTLNEFRDAQIDLLVSTTVIEVGVDVPNASIIVIEDADRFGLAQLHQLRGRVGRGDVQSYCLLIADPKTEEGVARMRIMTQTTDGFLIAEEDLRLRGPGEFNGTRQSGALDLPFLDLVRDVPVLHEARAEAISTLDIDPKLALPEHAPLRDEVRRRLQAGGQQGGES